VPVSAFAPLVFGAAQTFSVTPEGDGTGQPRIGVTARGTRHIDVGVGEALVRGVLEPARVVASFVETLSGEEEGELAGPIGLVGNAAKAVRANPVADLLSFAGQIMSIWWMGGVVAAVVFGLLGWRPDAERSGQRVSAESPSQR
jgi:hypothetical protein